MKLREKVGLQLRKPSFQSSAALFLCQNCPLSSRQSFCLQNVSEKSINRTTPTSFCAKIFFIIAGLCHNTFSLWHKSGREFSRGFFFHHKFFQNAPFIIYISLTCPFSSIVLLKLRYIVLKFA